MPAPRIGLLNRIMLGRVVILVFEGPRDTLGAIMSRRWPQRVFCSLLVCVILSPVSIVSPKRAVFFVNVPTVCDKGCSFWLSDEFAAKDIDVPEISIIDDKASVEKFLKDIMISFVNDNNDKHTNNVNSTIKLFKCKGYLK